MSATECCHYCGGSSSGTGYDPCASCAAKWALGVPFLEAVPASDGWPALEHGLRPTGSFVLMTRASVPRLVPDPDMAAAILRAGKAYVPPNVFTMLASEAQAAGTPTSYRKEH